MTTLATTLITEHGHVNSLLTCAAGCGIPLHPAAAAGGHDQHPGCETETAATPVTAWACVRCRAAYTALSTDHGVAMSRMHDLFACPMTARDRDELLIRISRRASLTRLYPTEVPAVTGRGLPGGQVVAVLGEDA